MGAMGRDDWEGLFVSFLISLAYGDATNRPKSIVVMSGCGGVVVVA